MIKYDVEYRRHGETAWHVLNDVLSISGTPQTIDMSTPTITLKLHSRNGRYSTKFKRSDEFRIYRAQALWFWGKITDQVRQVSDKTLEITLQERSYAKLQEVICMDAYRQLGYTAWKWGANTQNPGENAQGIRPDQMIRAAIGTHYYVQTFFESQAIFAVLTHAAVASQLLSITQAVVSGDQKYETSGTAITNILSNTLGGFSTMPNIRGTGAILISGDQPTGCSLDLYISRDGGATYASQLALPFDSGTGLWTVDPFVDGDFSAPGNRLVMKLVMHASSDRLDAPFIRAVLLDTIITDDDGLGDTGLSEGTIDTYDDPELDDDTIGADMSRRYRVEVAQAAVKGSVSNQDDEFPTWFGFIDSDGKVHYRDPSTYGDDLSGTVILSRDLGTLSDLKVTLDGNVINNLVYIGQGLPPYGEITITSNDYGGLKDLDSIAKYGEIQGTVSEKGIPSISYAVNRARIVLKNKKQPAMVLEGTPIPAFKLKGKIGDYVRVRDIEHNVDARVRIMAREHSWDSSSGEEEVTIVLSNNKFTLKAFLGQVARQADAQNMVGQGSSSPPSLSFTDNIDTDHPAELAFWLPRGVRIKGVKCYASSQKFRAYERGLAAASSTTSGSSTSPLVDTASDNDDFTLSDGGTHTGANILFGTGIDKDTVENIRVVVKIFDNDGVTWPPDDEFLIDIDIKTSDSADGTPLNDGGLAHFSPASSPFGERGGYDTYVPPSILSRQFIRGINVQVIHRGNSTFSDASFRVSSFIQVFGEHTHTIPGHSHDIDYGIFEYEYFPQGVQLFVKDYPAPGDNPNAGTLTQVFPSFGTRGTEDDAFEVESLDISAAFRDTEGAFRTGVLQKVWLLPQASTHNPDGLGRMTVHMFIELVEGVDTNQ